MNDKETEETPFRKWVNENAGALALLSFGTGFFLIGWGMGNRAGWKKCAKGWNVVSASAFGNGPAPDIGEFHICYKNGITTVLKGWAQPNGG